MGQRKQADGKANAYRESDGEQGEILLTKEEDLPRTVRLAAPVGGEPWPKCPKYGRAEHIPLAREYRLPSPRDDHWVSASRIGCPSCGPSTSGYPPTILEHMSLKLIIAKASIFGLLGVLLGICYAAFAPAGEARLLQYFMTLYALPLWGLGFFALALFACGTFGLGRRLLRPGQQTLPRR